MTPKHRAAIQNTDQGVPPWSANDARALAARLDWEDLRAFLQVVEQGGFRSAAAAMPVSVNTLRRRVERLETAVSATLLSRTQLGVATTAAGAMLLRVTREMRAATLDASTGDDSNVLVAPGELRIGCTEGLGSLWLTPRLNDLHARLDGLTVSLQLDYDMARDRSHEIDVGIAFAPPADPDLVCAKLATLHYMLFASDAYIREHGEMRSMDAFRDHRFVEQATPGVNSGLIDFLIGSDRPPGFVPIRSNSALSVYWAVASGAGIAALPSYARVMAKHLRPLDIPLPLRFELWYYYHPGARRSPAIRAAIDWLKAAFDPVDYPWFAERFIHPRDFAAARDGTVVPLFGGLLDFDAAAGEG